MSQIEFSIFKRGEYFKCAVCGKLHKKLSVFFYRDSDNNCYKTQAPIFCSKNCIDKIGVLCRPLESGAAKLYLMQSDGYLNSMEMMRDGSLLNRIFDKWGDSMEKMRGYRHYMVYPGTNTTVHLYYYVLKNDSEINKLMNFFNSSYHKIKNEPKV